MKIDLFVLPSVMRADFTDAFVLTKDEFHTRYPAFVEDLEMAGADFDEWYAETYLWDKMSPDLPQVSFDKALACLRERQGTVLFMSESESSRKPCSLLYHGRPLSDFVAMADPRELADRIEYEWMESARLFGEENRFMEDASFLKISTCSIRRWIGSLFLPMNPIPRWMAPRVGQNHGFACHLDESDSPICINFPEFHNLWHKPVDKSTSLCYTILCC